jgi:NAD+ kinase
MKQVGIVAHPAKIKDEQYLRSLETWFEDRGIRTLRYHCAPDEDQRSLPDTIAELDLIIVLGGDGTLLSTARRTAGLGLPILGVNMGYLGFITDMEMQDLFPNLDRLARGDYLVEPRMMLEAEVRRDGRPEARFLALNDTTITKGPLSRIVTLETYVDDECLAVYRADGMIVSTSTGSTAYSLSAGGPIVSPELDLMIVTPICPHTLYARPFITADRRLIRFVLKSESPDAMLTIDGQTGYSLQQGDEVLITRAEAVTNLVRLRNRPFFEVVRLKLTQMP